MLKNCCMRVSYRTLAQVVESNVALLLSLHDVVWPHVPSIASPGSRPIYTYQHRPLPANCHELHFTLS